MHGVGSPGARLQTPIPSPGHAREACLPSPSFSAPLLRDGAGRREAGPLYNVAASRLPARGGILAPVRSLPRVVVHAEHSAHMRITLCRYESGRSVTRTRITCASQPTGGPYRRTPECRSLHHRKASLASHPGNTLADSSGTAIPIPQMTSRSRAPRPSGTRTRVSVRAVLGAGIKFWRKPIFLVNEPSRIGAGGAEC
jgi:hypothetical protein